MKLIQNIFGTIKGKILSLLHQFKKSITKKPWAAKINPGGAAVTTQKQNDKSKIKN